ncbi:hypothetical protein C8R44DRAFT_759763 [Mycena epipterygia]|nr:hypothetical protein C8R44DRAFT_759763 [Mycena epipterygia]
MRRRESTAITKMPAVQHHLEPQTSGEDPRWEARLPPLQKDSLFPKCGECGVKLRVSLPCVPTISKRHNTVHRAYGVSRCGGCAKMRRLKLSRK